MVVCSVSLISTVNVYTDLKKEKKMPFIEIITDSKSQTQLNKVITKKMVNDCDILFIKDKNIENTKHI